MWWYFILVPLSLLVACHLYFTIFLKWYFYKTRGDKWFSLPLAERQAFENRLKKHTIILIPYLEFLSKANLLKEIPTFSYGKITGPAAIADKHNFLAAVNYQAGKDDIFVATQMKCGTTWMQQIVFEILHHGQGDLSDTGYRHMYALSPWIETSPNASVSMDNAPKVSPSQKRIIKTHLPAELCPYNNDARYIYVMRHPVSCFASCLDFLSYLSGPFCPETEKLKDWFCSERMWWGPWPSHVKGWWELSQTCDNVFFISFEELKDNIEDAVLRIAGFLGITLQEPELKTVLHKVSFEYMSENEALFQMAPPNIFSVSSPLRFMQSGKKKRDQNINEQVRSDIESYCAAYLENSSFPYQAIYGQSREETAKKP